jgi:hypothetical protein
LACPDGRQARADDGSRNGGADRGAREEGRARAGVFFTPNCRLTYDELKKRGVEFLAPPEDKFYGTEALLKDNSGNWFSMTTPAEQYAGTSPSSTKRWTHA